ncbi:MAG: hypothetical protein IK035_02975, partial [Firmicutes bacterium]|nr:hypothetical protein [Bacillota bacterium]
MKNIENINSIPKEKFTLVQENRRLTDQKFEDKPIGYFKDAWLRFCRNKGSIVAAIIILIIVLFSLLAPVFITSHTSTFMDVNYAKKPSRDLTLSKIGIAQGTTLRNFSEAGLLRAVAIGVGAEDHDGNTRLSIADGLKSYYQPIKNVGEAVTYSEIKGAKPKTVFNNCTVENYLEVGFIYKSVEQSEYARIIEWQDKTGIQVLYPLVANNEYNMDNTDANYWYKSKKGIAVNVVKNKAKTINYSDELVLEDNYKR